MSIPLFASLVSGLVVYKKFWRFVLRPRLRTDQGARIFWGDFHRLAGLWSVPFIAIMSVTAMWFFVQAVLEDTGRRLPGEIEHPHVERRNVATGPDRPSVHRISPDRAIAIARERFPGLAPAFLELPVRAFDPIEVTGRGAYPLIFETVYIDPYSGKVLAARGVTQRSKTAMVTESMRPLHTGDFAGLWLKLVYFLFGLLLTAMSLSGMLVWAKRSMQATRTLLGLSVGPDRKSLHTAAAE